MQPRKNKNEEDKLCAAFVKELRQLIAYHQVNSPESFRFWHNDNGQRAGRDQQARMIAGARAKRLGVSKGLLDYSFLWRDAQGTPFYGELEAKTSTGDLTPEQEERIAYLQRERIPCGEFRSVQQGLLLMQQWGIIKPGAVI